MLGMPDALARAIDLIRAIAGGEMREPPIDLWPEPQQPRSVFLRAERVSHLLGVVVPRKEIEQLLSGVGFVVAPRDERMAVQVPGWRPDVTREVDLIEEVARLRGYDSFPDELRPYRPTTVPEAPSETTLRHIRERLVRSGSGLLEARTLPLGPADGPEAVPVLNPLSADEGHLRSRLLPGLVRRVEHNWSVGQRDVRLFELGTVFRKAASGPRPDEEIHLGIVLTGARHPPHWSDASQSGEGAKLPDMDIWDLKQHFELAVGVSAPFCTLQPALNGTGWVATNGDGARERGSGDATRGGRARWGSAAVRTGDQDRSGGSRHWSVTSLCRRSRRVRDLSPGATGAVTAARVEAVLRREGERPRAVRGAG